MTPSQEEGEGTASRRLRSVPTDPGALGADASVDGSAAQDGASEASADSRRTLFRVVRGGPDDAEVAALTSVLAAAAS
ncbi:MAG TPA: acyl-CoA carboxylase subunit epsilon, partial [Pseudonocardia sp.]